MSDSDRRGLPERSASDRATSVKKKPYEPPRVLTDEAFEQLSLACTTKMGTKKNFT